MRHDFQIITQKNAQTNAWAGGTTTELYIFPKSARYSKKNFDFRISIATVEVDSSIFTPLPKVLRTTVVLEGKTELSHAGQYTKQLPRLEQDSYDGGWETSSTGKSTNFNVMTRGSTKAEVRVISLEQDEQTACPTDRQTCIYVHTGRIAIVMLSDAQIVEAGSLFVAPTSLPLVITKALEESEIILTTLEK